jgi:hypothetical protein
MSFCRDERESKAFHQLRALLFGARALTTVSTQPMSLGQPPQRMASSARQLRWGWRVLGADKAKGELRRRVHKDARGGGHLDRRSESLFPPTECLDDAPSGKGRA